MRLLVEHVDKGGADRLALVLGVGDAGELVEKQVAGVAMHQRDVVVAAEQAHDLLRLAQAQQPGVDEDAGQLVADRLVQQGRGDRRSRPRRKGRRSTRPLPTWRADALDRLGAERGHRPVAADAADPVGEVAQQQPALRRVHDLGVEQDAVKAPGVIGGRGEGRAVADRHRAEIRRQRIDLVAVAHPYLLARALRPQPLEQPALAGDVDKGAAEFLVVAEGDAAAKLGAHRLHAVADRQTGTSRSNTRSGARGVVASVTEAGPPDRMMPAGANSRILSALAV